jgi:hypothetical protein
MLPAGNEEVPSGAARMGYLSQYEHDVFVSYAHFDNAGEERWVTRLGEDLKRALTQRLGEEPDMFFDEKALKGNEPLEELKGRAYNSAIFVPIVTPSYVKRNWTTAEMEAFAKNSDEKRVFAIDALPLDNESDYPVALRNLIRKPFWHRRSDGGVPVTIDREIDKELYKQLIATQAENIRTKLVAMRGSGAKAAPVTAPIATVLLAEVTSDLELDREQLRSHLQQFNIAVIPEGAYPGGGTDFAAAVKADCQRASHFIQLLGPFSDRRPADLPEGYACHQYDAAVAAKLKPMLWCRPDLDLKKMIEQHRDARLFQTPELMMTGINDFKADAVRVISEQFRKKEELKKRKEDGDRQVTPGNNFIFVDSIQSDLPIAQNLASKITQRKRSAYLPVFDGPPEVIQEDLQSSIVDCSALVLVFGNAQPTWVRAQLRLKDKLLPRREDGRPLKVLAVYTHAPAEKDQLGIYSPDIIWIDGHANHDEAIEDMLRKLDA